MRLGAGFVARGEQEGNNQNDFQLPEYVLVNLLASYALKVGKTNITAQLNVNNLLNEHYFPSSIGFGRSRIDVGAPRIFLGSLRIDY